MDNTYNFKIEGITHDYFADAIKAGKPTMTDSNCLESNVVRFARVIIAYTKAKANIDTIKALSTNKPVCEISANIGIGTAYTNISRIVLAHFGVILDHACRYKDKDGKILDYNVYDMESLLCHSNVQRQDAFKQFFIKKNKKSRKFFVPSNFTPLPVYLGVQQIVDVCTCYIIEHIDTAIEYMNKFHPIVAKQFANTSLVGMSTVNTNTSMVGNATAPTVQTTSVSTQTTVSTKPLATTNNSASKVAYKPPVSSTPIDVTKLKRLVTLMNNIANNEIKNDIIASVLSAIIVHKTVESAQADVMNIKYSVKTCFKGEANFAEIASTVDNLSEVLVASL
jgi:hypothetical protein